MLMVRGATENKLNLSNPSSEIRVKKIGKINVSGLPAILWIREIRFIAPGIIEKPIEFKLYIDPESNTDVVPINYAKKLKLFVFSGLKNTFVLNFVIK